MTVLENYDHLALLYEGLIDIAGIVEVNHYLQVFYCGKYKKWGSHNSLLIIVDDQLVRGNRFYQEMMTGEGCRGGAYLSRYVSGWGQKDRKYEFRYKVITNLVWEGTPWTEIVDDRWELLDKDKIIDITNEVNRIGNLIAFL